MAKQNRTTLKGYFETGDTPSQAQYADLIDSNLNLSETGIQTLQSSISCSGNISASGYLSIGGAITASGDISSSGIGTFASLDISGNIDVDGTTNLDVVDIDGAVDMASTLTIASHITASGNISASGTVEASAFTLNGTPIGTSTDTFWNSGSAGNIFYNGGNVGIGTSSPTKELTVTGDISASGNLIVSQITASDNISSSGDILANRFLGDGQVLVLPNKTTSVTFSNNNIATTTIKSGTTISLGNDTSVSGHITASGNISASGVITAEGLVIIDDASITDTLTVGTIANVNTTHITASGQISASGTGIHHIGGDISASGDIQLKFNKFIKGALSDGTTDNIIGLSSGLFIGDSVKYATQINGSELYLSGTSFIRLQSNGGTVSFKAASSTPTVVVNTIEGHIFVLGNISVSKFIHSITTAASQDLNTSIDYSVNGSKVEVRAITAAQIDDGDFATFKLLNTSIATNSIVLGSLTGTHAVSTMSGSIITAATIAASTASVFIHNETGAAIAADTAFTASFVIF